MAEEKKRILLRLPRSIWYAAKEAAEAKGISLNAFCWQAIEAKLPESQSNSQDGECRSTNG